MTQFLIQKSPTSAGDAKNRAEARKRPAKAVTPLRAGARTKNPAVGPALFRRFKDGPRVLLRRNCDFNFGVPQTVDGDFKGFA